jgi:hypothetical protein
MTYVGGLLFCVDRRNYIVITSTEQCLSVLSTPLKKRVNYLQVKLYWHIRGLFERKDVVISFFLFCEYICRSMFPSENNHSLQCYIDYVCNRSDVVFLFYTCIHFHDVIVNYISWSHRSLCSCTALFLFRCHAKCRQFVEKYLCQTKSQRKLTALRKTVWLRNECINRK